MKALALTLLLCVSAAGAAEAQRASTVGMLCSQAQALVEQRGAIVLNTSRTTYERFVSHPGYCDPHQMAVSAWAPTRDVQQCPIAYRCVLRDDDDWLRRRF